MYFLKCIYTEKTGNALRVIHRIILLNRENRELIKQMNNTTKIFEKELEKQLKEIEIRSKQEHDRAIQVQEQIQERTQELYKANEEIKYISKALKEAQDKIRILDQKEVLMLFKAELISRKDEVDESDYILVKKIFESKFSDYIKVGNRDDKITKINDFYRLNKQPNELEVIIVISDNEIPKNDIKSFYSYLKQEITRTNFRDSGNNFITFKEKYMDPPEVILIDERLTSTLQ